MGLIPNIQNFNRFGTLQSSGVLNPLANKESLKTGNGDMFSTSMTEVKLEHLASVFAELDELLQDYLIKQASELLEIQKKKMKNDSGAKRQHSIKQ